MRNKINLTYRFQELFRCLSHLKTYSILLETCFQLSLMLVNALENRTEFLIFSHKKKTYSRPSPRTHRHTIYPFYYTTVLNSNLTKKSNKTESRIEIKICDKNCV